MGSIKQIGKNCGLTRRDFLRFSTGAAAALATLSLPNLMADAATTQDAALFAQSDSRTLTKIADGVYSYVDVKKMSAQNSFGANAGIIIGAEEIVVIDTLISAKEARRFINDIRSISDKPIKYVINTHFHLDHTFGNSEFEKVGATVISQSIDNKRLKDRGEAILKNISSYGLTEQDIEGTAIVTSALAFTDRIEIDLGNQAVELIYVGSSHTEGSILIYLPEKKILFAGDTLYTGYHAFVADGDIKNWLNVLDYILALDVISIIPGHGRLSNKQDVLDMKEYLTIFDAKAKELCSKSNDLEYIAAELKKALPQRDEGDRVIKGSIKRRYLNKNS